MGVEVRVLHNCPLPWPGLVLVREETVWWIVVDPRTPQDQVELAVDYFRSLAELAEAPAEESEEDGEALLSTRRGGWTWPTTLGSVECHWADNGGAALPRL